MQDGATLECCNDHRCEELCDDRKDQAQAPTCMTSTALPGASATSPAQWQALSPDPVAMTLTRADGANVRRAGRVPAQWKQGVG